MASSAPTRTTRRPARWAGWPRSKTGPESWSQLRRWQEESWWVHTRSSSFTESVIDISGYLSLHVACCRSGHQWDEAWQPIMITPKLPHDSSARGLNPLVVFLSVWEGLVWNICHNRTGRKHCASMNAPWILSCINTPFLKVHILVAYLSGMEGKYIKTREEIEQMN